MKKIFKSTTERISFTDEGIILERQQRYLPYGCIKKIKLGFMNILSITDYNGILYTFVSSSEDKKSLKEIVEHVSNIKDNFPRTEVVKLSPCKDPISLPKNANDIIEYFGGLTDKFGRIIAEGIPSLLNSMDDDEKILHVFDGTSIHIKDQSVVAEFVAWISNKRLYYSGTGNSTVLTQGKTGYVDLKDIHAISTGTMTIASMPYVRFEVKNEDYKLNGMYREGAIEVVKSVLEEACKQMKAESSTSATVIVQNSASSADELKKFKELLDSGIITQEEFEAKKKQLLGL